MRKLFFLLSIVILSFGCENPANEPFNERLVYVSESLRIKQITENTYIHTSFLQTDDFGYVPCNGLIIRGGNEVIIFDTPTTDTTSIELTKWLTDSLHCAVKAVVPTHFHNDCLGGLNAFIAADIPSYANASTISLAVQNKSAIPVNAFNDSMRIHAGNTEIVIKYFGEGHTKDNVVAYCPSEHVLFGGCLIKELNASEGYLGDANVAEWSRTVTKVKQAYPQVKLVVPGHGAYGDAALLDYTIQLFAEQGK